MNSQNVKEMEGFPNKTVLKINGDLFKKTVVK